MLYFYLFVKKIERIYTFYRVFYHLWSIPIESGDRMSLSKKLSYLKHKEKLTTLEIAQRTSLPVGTLNKIFSGQTLSPSLKIIDRLSTLFHVPSHYLIDDEIPVGCSIGAYVESQGLLMLSEREGELFDLFRQLDEHNKQTIEWITRALARQLSRNRIRVKERDGKSETGKGRESQSYQGKQRTSMRRPPRRGRALSSSTRTAARGSSGGFLYS